MPYIINDDELKLIKQAVDNLGSAKRVLEGKPHGYAVATAHTVKYTLLYLESVLDFVEARPVTPLPPPPATVSEVTGDADA